MQLKRGALGFSLLELAVVFLIVAFLLGGAIVTLSSQFDARNVEETQRRLEAAKEAILGFAIVNGRLPCPARYASPTSHSAGLESFCDAASGSCTPTTELRTHGVCSNFYDGYVPGVSLGLPVDANGFAIDAWGNRLRYAVSKALYSSAVTPVECRPNGSAPLLPPFTSKNNLKSNGVGCRTDDIDLCTSTACTARAVSTRTAVLLVYSTGRNGASPADAGSRPNEYENLDADASFVFRTPDPAGVSGGEFDDQIVIVPVGTFYSKLLAAGIMP